MPSREYAHTSHGNDRMSLNSKLQVKSRQQIKELPENWPEDVEYLVDHTYSANALLLQPKLSRGSSDDASWVKIPAQQIIAPSPLVKIVTITDEKHPAHGQRGLFAAEDLKPGQFILLYLGHVHTGSMADQDPNSDYDLNLDRELGLSVDAARSGNESRHANDYRSIAERPNASFEDIFIEVKSKKRADGHKWERRVAIFVLPAGKAQKRKNGIRAGEEILVSYGKGFWEARQMLAKFRGDQEMLAQAKTALEY